MTTADALPTLNVWQGYVAYADHDVRMQAVRCAGKTTVAAWIAADARREVDEAWPPPRPIRLPSDGE